MINNHHEIEKAVLAALVGFNDLFVENGEFLSEGLFFDPTHKLMFQAIAELQEEGREMDYLSVVDLVEKKRKGIDISCLDADFNQYSFQSYCLILRERMISEKQKALAQEILRRASDPSIDPIESNAFLIDKAYECANLENVKSGRTNLEIIKDLTAKIESAVGKSITGVPTGLQEVDRIFGGRQGGELIILAARPGMGKTSLALTEFINCAKLGYKPAFFSLEMPDVQLMNRIVSIESGLNSSMVKEGLKSNHEWDMYHKTVGEINELDCRIFHDCTSLQSIILKMKKLSAKKQLDIAFVDYLQLIENSNGNNREQQISDISRKLKRTALELDIPVVALAQLSRAVETRGGDKRPMLSDLRESGAIEQDADVVQFLYRPEYYGFTEDAEGNPTTGLAVNIVAKNRSGSLGDIVLRFIAHQTKFTDNETGNESNQFPSLSQNSLTGKGNFEEDEIEAGPF